MKYNKKYVVSESYFLQHIAPPILAMTVIGGIWEMYTRLAKIPTYILPSPVTVIDHFYNNFPNLVTSGGITLIEAVAGFIIGSTLAMATAILMGLSRILERSLYPVALLVKVTPMVAIAPLLVIWFGFNMIPIILVAAVITFFPVMVNTYIGLRSINTGILDVFKSVHASNWEIFINLRIPSSLPYVFAGFRVAIPLSVIGAFVGEFFSGNRGLGGIMFVAYHNLDMPALFSAILILAIIGICLTVTISYVEKRWLFWHESFLNR